MGYGGPVHGQVGTAAMMSMSLPVTFKPWGYYYTVYRSPQTWTKVLVIEGGEELSLQYHANRTEYWTPAEDGLIGVIGNQTFDLKARWRYDVQPNAPHQIINPTGEPLSLIEVATGHPDEDDIVRLKDKYGRI